MGRAGGVRKKRRKEKQAGERDAIVSILARIPEFSSFSREQLVRMASRKIETWGPDEFIISEGSDDLDQMIVLLGGEVSIRKRMFRDGEEFYDQVAEISGPAIIGENSFFTGMPRSAGVYAAREAPGIIIRRDDLMRLISLDKSSFVRFLKQLATENLQRAERTLVYYMGTLQLVLKQALVRRSLFYRKLDRINEKIIRAREEVDEWEAMVSDILLFIRDLNNALEELYRFAHLPDIILLSVDKERFSVSESHRFHDLFTRLVDELAALQSLVPLRNLNFRDIALSLLLDEFETRGDGRIDYPTVISHAALLYDEFILRHDELGIEMKRAAIHKLTRPRDDSPLSALLWEQ